MAVGMRRRGKSGPGKAAWVAFGGAAFVGLAFTFALGVFVGQEWARQPPRATAPESVHRSATSPRRSGLGDVGRTRPPQEKLTFYQTLTAPLDPGLPRGKAAVAPKPEPAVTPRPSGPPATDRPAVRPSERSAETLLPARTVAVAQRSDRSGASGEDRRDSNLDMPAGRQGEQQSAGEGRAAHAEWTVQVGVFKTPQRAERIRKELAEAGFHPRVTPATGEDGQPRFRVRLGEFKTKEEALRTAERIRADRSLPTFVTAK